MKPVERKDTTETIRTLEGLDRAGFAIAKNIIEALYTRQIMENIPDTGDTDPGPERKTA